MRWPDLLICAGLLAASGFVFGQTVGHDFVDFDDHQYITRNPHVTTGITPGNIVWAFTSFHKSNWHPLTWISHMVDVELYGMDRGRHHLTGFVLHGINGVLVFLVLSYLTATRWRSALVAALFVVHPLRVESVAWAAERKDVLSALFFLLTLWAYAHFVRSGKKLHYGVALVLFAMGLMSKPMLVTLPIVLLLLDFWPLQRPWKRRALLEKVPFLLLSGGSSVITLIAQRSGGAIVDLETVPLVVRMANAAVSYVLYVWKAIWPVKLAPMYPLHGMPPLWLLGLASVLVVGASVGATVAANRDRWVATGWWWYVVMLVPVIGIVQVGQQALADRYTYLPFIGIFIVFSWSIERWVGRWSLDRRVVGVALIGLLVALAVVAQRQVAHWKDSLTLFAHTVAVTRDNAKALTNLGSALAQRGRLAEAEVHFREAVAVQPDHAGNHYNLGSALLSQNRLEEAIEHLRTAVRLDPESVDAHNNLGVASLRARRLDSAIPAFEDALRLRPDFAEAHYNLGEAYLMSGMWDDAIREYQAAFELRPDLEAARRRLEQARSRRDARRGAAND